MPTVLEGAESPGLSPDGASVGNTTCKSVSTAVSISAPTSHRHMEGMNFTSPSKPSVERSPWKAIHAQGDSLSGDSLSAESPSWQPPSAFMERSPVPPPDGWSASSRGPPLTVSPLLAGRSKLGEGRRRGERAPLCAPDAYMCAMRETLSTSPLAAAGKSLFRSASEPQLGRRGAAEKASPVIGVHRNRNMSAFNGGTSSMTALPPAMPTNIPPPSAPVQPSRPFDRARPTKERFARESRSLLPALDPLAHAVGCRNSNDMPALHRQAKKVNMAFALAR